MLRRHEVGEAYLGLASTVYASDANTTLESASLYGFVFCQSYMRPAVLLTWTTSLRLLTSWYSLIF